MAGTAATIGLLLLPFFLCQEVKDDSRVISVAWTNNSFQVLQGMWVSAKNLANKSQNWPQTKENSFYIMYYILGLKYMDSVVVWANLTDDQENNGWKYLEITTNEKMKNEIQAKAAGFAEGYLTRNFIYHYYQGEVCFNIYVDQA